MAASKSNPGKMPLALELLWADHRNVEDLFEEYEGMKEAEDDSRRDTAERICKELTVHATIEEEIFYPWLRKALDEDDLDMVEEAEVEHAGAKDLIAQIQGARALDDKYDAKVKVLSEYIKHHVKEEEEEIFPEVRDQSEKLDELGQQMAARKAELAAKLGLDANNSVRQSAPFSKDGSMGARRNA
jgi:hemerythrin superfamily protein